ncbi:MAG: cysteine hydrolase family protein [Thermodesulfobacteriota bacterium]
MKTALIVVDVQNDYFPGGRMPVEGSVEAAQQTRLVLAYFRKSGLPLAHIQHISDYPGARFLIPDTPGVEINEAVAPQPGETVFRKRYPNSFRDTPLPGFLRDSGVRRLIICGMMTHMCIDATVRAAFDLGFKCVVLGDACATRALTYRNVEIPAAHVHGAFLAALSPIFATVTDVATFLSDESTTG